MSDLVAFLRARLDEDEEVAFGGAPSPWRHGEWAGDFDGPREVLDRHGDVTARTYYGGTHGHVMRFDPTRILREVEAKRRLIDLEMHSGDPAWCYSCHDVSDKCPTLRLLALPYASHPDYDEGWAP